MIDVYNEKKLNKKLEDIESFYERNKDNYKKDNIYREIINKKKFCEEILKQCYFFDDENKINTKINFFLDYVIISLKVLTLLVKLYSFESNYYYEYKKDSEKAIDTLKEAINLILKYIDNESLSELIINAKDNNQFGLDHANNMLYIPYGILNDEIGILYANLANIYKVNEQIDEAIDALEDSVKRNNIISIKNLFLSYQNPYSNYYNPIRAEELCFLGANIDINAEANINGTCIYSINEKNIKPYYVILSKEQYLIRTRIIIDLCIRAASILNTKNKYNDAINYYDRAIKIMDKNGNSKEEIDNLRKQKRNAIDNLNIVITHTSKYEEIKKMFSEKAQKHLTDEQYKFIESSIIIYDYLNEIPNNEGLDYSGAIISLFKCLEDILFKVFGDRYYDYISTLEKIDYDLIPRDFRVKKKGIYLEQLCSKEKITMEFGSFSYACRELPFGNKFDSINPYFKDFAEKEGMINFEKEWKNFTKRLDDITQNFRNPTAHKNIIRKVTADDCRDQLLLTINFINYCLDLFY